MDKTYAIIWTATQRGSWGLGTKRYSKDEAEALAAQLNEEHGQFLHRAIDVANEDPAAVLAAMKAAEAAENARIVNYPDLVAAEAAAAVANELVDEKLIWLRPFTRVSPMDVPAA
jgi:hypothetical protein